MPNKSGWLRHAEHAPVLEHAACTVSGCGWTCAVRLGRVSQRLDTTQLLHFFN
jgi:hypothetical protein